MPAWLTALIAKITPLESVASGLVAIGEAVVKEVTSSDDPITKGVDIIGDLATASTEVTTALHANTPSAGTTPAA
jgi:hypothetical protein